MHQLSRQKKPEQNRNKTGTMFRFFVPNLFHFVPVFQNSLNAISRLTYSHFPLKTCSGLFRFCSGFFLLKNTSEPIETKQQKRPKFFDVPFVPVFRRPYQKSGKKLSRHPATP
jgi:hypothetical protein